MQKQKWSDLDFQEQNVVRQSSMRMVKGLVMTSKNVSQVLLLQPISYTDIDFDAHTEHSTQWYQTKYLMINFHVEVIAGDDEVLGLINGGGCCNIVLWLGINLKINIKKIFKKIFICICLLKTTSQNNLILVLHVI